MYERTEDIVFNDYFKYGGKSFGFSYRLVFVFLCTQLFGTEKKNILCTFACGDFHSSLTKVPLDLRDF